MSNTKHQLIYEGIEIGTERGIEKGIEIGKEQGIEKGIEIGKEQGIEEDIGIGKEQGIEIGKEEGIEIGMERGAEKGKIEILYKKLQYSIKQISEELNIPLECVRDIVNELNCK
ncbi:hypothetical protein AN644_01935 [Candidatus Epulonipiscium fishelsonii]|nr:hypothetical protein AN644_01935 [Epulopiscium sp. SCG-C06WGA-EpuloA1]